MKFFFEPLKTERKAMKKQFSDEELDVLADKFKILSESSRLKILRTLFGGERCVSDIIDATGLLQANVSKQLKILQLSGIIDCRPSGLQRFYKVVDTTVVQICHKVCSTKLEKN